MAGACKRWGNSPMPLSNFCAKCWREMRENNEDPSEYFNHEPKEYADNNLSAWLKERVKAVGAS